MLKGGIGLIAVALFALAGAGTFQRGCQDLKTSLTHLNYYPKRDMRSTVALLPQRGFYRAPDSIGVPTVGRELRLDREVLAATLTNPIPTSDASIAAGERKFAKTCVPCHGKTLKGDGPVAAKFIPPPDLLGPTTRARKDGYIYSYIRHGGAVMPSYGAQVSAEEAWHLINYIRHLQQTSPR